jgi:hypothetical protein
MTPRHGSAILLVQPEALDVASTASALAPILGMHPSDTARRLVARHGIVARELDEGCAQAVSRALDDLRVPHLRFPESDIVDLPRAVDLHTLNFRLPQCLVVATEGGETDELPWDAVAVMCVGHVDMGCPRHHDLADVLPVIGRTVMRMVMPEGVGATGGGIVPPRTMLCLAGLRPGGGPFHYRVVAGSFSFACLQDAIGPLAAENFRRLVAELRSHLPRVATNVTDRMMTHAGLTGWPVYLSATELEREVFHRIQVVAHGGERGGLAAP